MPLPHVGSYLPLGGTGECDPCFCVAGAIVSEPRSDLFHLRESFSRVMLENRFQATPRCWNFRSNIHFNQLATRSGSQFQDALDATL